MTTLAAAQACLAVAALALLMLYREIPLHAISLFGRNQ